MKIRCPQCGGRVGLKTARCRRCSFSLTLGGVWNHVMGRLKERSMVACPSCAQPVPISAKDCPHCFTLFTLENAIGATLEPSRVRVEGWMASRSSAFKRRVQWAVFLLSLGLLWSLLGGVPDTEVNSLVMMSFLSAVYLGFFGFLSVFFLPRQLILAIRYRASTLAKLSLITNFFSAILLLQLAIGTWQKQAVALAMLFGTVWFGAVILTRFFWPMCCDVLSLFQARIYFDPANDQGRSAGYR